MFYFTVLSICVLVTKSYLLVLIMIDGMGGVEPRCHHYCLYATLTPVLRSLDHGVARRVAGPVDCLHT